MIVVPYIPPQHGKDCLANVRECRENQRKYPEHIKSAIMGECDWMQEHILSGGNVGDLIHPVNGDYSAFLEKKMQWGSDSGFAPLWMPEFLFDFQKDLLDWAIRKGRAAI